MPNPPLVLASSSPRRREILTSLGLEFTVVHVDIDETAVPGEDARTMVLRLAREKARAAAGDGEVVVAADTAVVVDGESFGKPVNREHALAMLAQLSGRDHEVLTGVAVCANGRVDAAISRTRVSFRAISRDEALHYWRTGEPRDKAGAYGIQGLGGVFASNIEGSYSGVVGLPVFETAALLARAGFCVAAQHREQDQ